MRFWLPTLAIAALIVVLVLAMRHGWRRREAATEHIVGELPAAPAEAGQRLTEEMKATYVSTTRAGEWLDRVVAHDLGARAHGSVQARTDGVSVVREGSIDLYIPASRIAGVRRERGIAGKVMGSRDVVVVTWRLEQDVDTGLVLRHRGDTQRLVDAVGTLVSAKEA